MITILDTGLDEIRQIREAFSNENQSTVTSSDKEVLLRAERVILYSSSSFGVTMYTLQEKGLDRVIKERVMRGRPLFAIGVGMQLLFTSSDQDGYHKGLNVLSGHVVPFPEGEPFEGMSWVSFKYPHPTLRHMEEGNGYFSHSFFVRATNQDDVIALNQENVAAVVGRGNVLGVQFYPEMSGEWGRQWLKECEMCKTK